MPHILITLNEAQLLDSIMKGEPEDFWSWQPFLVRVGNIIVTGQSQVVEVTQPLLWYIRSKIELSDMVGNEKTGWMLLQKVYTLLIDITRGALHNLPQHNIDIIEITTTGGVEDAKAITRYQSCASKDSSQS